MEQVIKTYGTFLLEAVVMIVLFWLLFWEITDESGNHGVFAIAGAYHGEEAPVAETDFALFRAESEKSAPTVRYVWTDMLCVGEYALSDLLRAEDHSGQVLQIELRSVCDPWGIERTEADWVEQGRIRFDRQGVYTVSVRAVDAWNRGTVCEIRIPVNGGAI